MKNFIACSVVDVDLLTVIFSPGLLTGDFELLSD